MSAGWAPAAATHTSRHACTSASTRRTIHTSKHIHPVTLFMLRISRAAHTLRHTLVVPWQRVFPQRRLVILRLKEFSVDYFWTEAGSFGKERPGHFEDLTSSSHCLPKSLGVAPATHTHTHAPNTHTRRRSRIPLRLRSLECEDLHVCNQLGLGSEHEANSPPLKCWVTICRS